MEFEVGQSVGVPATYSSGPFPDELLISLGTEGRRISGFVKRANIKFVDDTNALVAARITSVGDDTVTLQLRGSFFTTNGVEPVSKGWARNNFQSIAA